MSPFFTAVITFQPGRAATWSVRDAELAIGEEDDLGILGDEPLDGDVELVLRAGRDGLGAGELDHLGEERFVGRAVDRTGRVELVEDPRVGQVLHRRRHGVEARLHLAADRVGLGGLADGVAGQRDVVEDLLDRRGVDDDDRQAEAPEPLDVVGRRAEVATGEHDVRRELSDLLDVDLDWVPSNAWTSGIADAAGG